MLQTRSEKTKLPLRMKANQTVYTKMKDLNKTLKCDRINMSGTMEVEKHY
jgi:hypothetical protein